VRADADGFGFEPVEQPQHIQPLLNPKGQSLTEEL
jgi:hypothetical protein